MIAAPDDDEDHFFELQRPGEDDDEYIGRFVTDWARLRKDDQDFMEHWLRAMHAVRNAPPDERERVTAAFESACAQRLGKKLS